MILAKIYRQTVNITEPEDMYKATELLIDDFVKKLRSAYHRTYGRLKPDYPDILAWAGAMALENIANSDALYHNIEHTIIVTLVGLEILRGKHIQEGGVSCEDWLHFTISLLYHDIGYVKGVCLQDRPGCYATGINNTMVELPAGKTDASLAPYRVARGKLFVQERFGGHKLINAKEIQKNIEFTRFALASALAPEETKTYPGLVRAADLIGELSEERYFLKLPALFYEFEETGYNQQLGCKGLGDLRRHYTEFYWNTVYPFIADAMTYLELTQEGKRVLTILYSNLFAIKNSSIDKSSNKIINKIIDPG